MKKSRLLLFLIICGLTVSLAACGGKSQEKITSELKKSVEDLSGYKANAEMSMQTGQDEQKYLVEIWHKKDDFYRVKLTDSLSEQESQVILKNEDGVFVLTPELDKKFKFQTDWPHNSSQAYLFQSLVNDILQDPDATFEETDDYYAFQTKANYQGNNQMPYQEIYFDKKDLTPIMVKVLDQDRNSVVEVSFTSFELNGQLTADDFEVEKNMADALAHLSEVDDDRNMDDDRNEDDDRNGGENDENREEGDQNLENDEGEIGNIDDEENGKEGEGEEGNDNNESFEVLFPLETLGSELTDQKEIDLEDGKRILMVFSGDKNFTLVQEKKTIYPTLSAPYEVKGDIVNLGFTIGALSDHGVEWSLNGVDYYLASDELTEEELIHVAQSVQGRAVK